MSSDAPATEAAAPSLASRISRDAPPADTPAAESEAPAAAPEVEGDGQADGAAEEIGGSKLEEPEYDVEVKLHNLQEDPKNPLFSIKTFEELGL
jgi:ATP-dependent RNA helicase DDX19/DBP5